MKYAGGLLIFLVVFVAVGIAMHLALYSKPGIFVWSIDRDSETGKSVLVRTTVAIPGESDAEEAGPATEAEVLEELPAPEPVAATSNAQNNEVLLFDGKDLGKWVKTQFGGEGDVFVNEDACMELGFGAVVTGVHWGEAPPALSNYEISLDAMKLDGNDFFIALTFPVKDSHATFVVGGWGGGVVGISSVDDLNASENETMNIEGFEKNVWYKIRVRVTDDKIKAWIDEEEMVDLDLVGKKISLLPGDIELSVPIGLAAYQTRAQYRNIVWQNLTTTE